MALLFPLVSFNPYIPSALVEAKTVGTMLTWQFTSGTIFPRCIHLIMINIFALVLVLLSFFPGLASSY